MDAARVARRSGADVTILYRRSRDGDAGNRIMMSKKRWRRESISFFLLRPCGIERTLLMESSIA